MKKLIIAVAAVFVLVGGIAFVVAKQSKDSSSKSSSASSSTAKGKSACELLTLADAKTLLGSNATLNSGSESPTAASTSDVKVDVCSYSSDGATLGDLKQLTLENHFGDKTQVKAGFDNYRKSYPGSELPNLGEAAYYSTEGKQVHVLKNGYWLFVAGGSINNGDEGNKALEIQAAELIAKKL